MRLKLLYLVFCTAAGVAVAQVSVAPYLNSKLSPESRAHDLVSRMTLEEKAAQMLNTAPAIPRLGVPAYDYWSEGLHGMARSGYSTLFPQAIGMAATWDAPLLHEIGDAVSIEARAKYNEAVRQNIHSIYLGLTVWSPNINIFRDPRWGRGQETYGEDPFLTAQLGLQFIRGLQGSDPMHPRVVATPKHFAVHSGPESERHRFNVDPTPHDLWDTYLPQFRTAIVDGHADSIMCAYNALYGKPACGNDLLLKTVLRDDWKFNGFVTSDCGAIDDFYDKSAHHYSADAEHAAATAVLAGTDTNCGRTYSALPAAVRAGLLTEADVDRATERLFVARIRLGLFDPESQQPYAKIPYTADRSQAHLALSLKAAEESMVLLKDDGILPLKPGSFQNIAVIGPNAASLSALEGNYNAVGRDPDMPIDSLRAALHGATLKYAQGAAYADGVPLPVPRYMLHPNAGSAEEGLHAEYFAAKNDPAETFASTPVATRLDHQIDFDWAFAAPMSGLQQDAFAVRWSGVIVPPQAGEFDFDLRLSPCYPCEDIESLQVSIDGKVVSTFATKAAEGRENTTPRFRVDFPDTHPHAIEVKYTHASPLFGAGVTLEWVPPPGLLQREAEELVKQSDLVVAMVGLSPELEGEEMKISVPGFKGGDRTDIVLPESQIQMLHAAKAQGKPMIVVLMNGSALSVPFAQENANAILEAWYPGEFGGKAVADTLTGVNNPAGRLPITFYRSVDDLPPFTDYSMAKRTYRYYDGTPLYPFGFGLSYTKFSYSNFQLSTTSLKAGEPLNASVRVKNTGTLAGDEVVQLYLAAPQSGNGGLSPRIQLVGFKRISLKPHESQAVSFSLNPRDLSEVNAAGLRSVQPGSYTIFCGGSLPAESNAAAKREAFTIQGSFPIPR